MKRQILTLTALLALPALALADICSDIETQYKQLIAQENQLANDAIAFSASSAEQEAIWSTFLIRKSILEAEMTATLTASGCIDSTSSGGDNNTGGGNDDPIIVVEDPLPGDGGDNGSDDGNNNNNDGGSDDDENNGGGDTGIGDNSECLALKEEVRAEARRLALESGRGFSAGAQYARSRKAEIVSVCGNFGRGRSYVGGNNGHKKDHDSVQVTEKKKGPKTIVVNGSSPVVNIVDCNKSGHQGFDRRSRGRGHKKGHSR